MGYSELLTQAGGSKRAHDIHWTTSCMTILKPFYRMQVGHYLTSVKMDASSMAY